MHITRTTDPTPTHIQAIYALWNNEYPAEISYTSLAAFEDYLANLTSKEHLLLHTEDGAIVGWAFSFMREGAIWFAIMLDSAIHDKGYGTMLLQQLKSKNAVLNGWVVDHNNSFRQNGTPYTSPLAFYLKSGFMVRPEIRLETDKISAVKIEWRAAQ